MEHTTREATRFPLNFTNATVTVRGTTPEGIVMVLEVANLIFKDPNDAAILEIQPRRDIEPHRHLRLTSPKDLPSYMLDLTGTMVPPNPADPTGEEHALFTVKVDQPEDLERMVRTEPIKEPVPSSWQDPECWS